MAVRVQKWLHSDAPRHASGDLASDVLVATHAVIA